MLFGLVYATNFQNIIIVYINIDNTVAITLVMIIVLTFTSSKIQKLK